MAAELQPGEKVVWTGVPIPVIQNSVAISLAIAGAVFAGLFIALVSGEPLAVAAGLIPLPLIAMYFWTRKTIERLANRSAYAITDRRLILVSQGQTRDVVSVDLADIGDVQRIVKADGSGTITISRTAGSVTRRPYAYLSPQGFIYDPCLFNIADADMVARLIEEVRENRKAFMRDNG